MGITGILTQSKGPFPPPHLQKEPEPLGVHHRNSTRSSERGGSHSESNLPPSSLYQGRTANKKIAEKKRLDFPLSRFRFSIDGEHNRP